MRTNPRVRSVFGGAAAASVLLVAAIAVLPGATKLIAAAAILVGFITIYPRALSCALVPQRDSVDLYVDQGGIYADDAPLALRGDIENAYIRPALDAGTSHHASHGGAALTSYHGRTPSPPSWPGQHRPRGPRTGRGDLDRAWLSNHDVCTQVSSPNQQSTNHVGGDGRAVRGRLRQLLPVHLDPSLTTGTSRRN
jgi:hypothetical protein